MLFGMTSSLTFLHRYCLTGTTIAVGTLGWDYDTGSPDPGGVAVYEYNEASDVWDIVGSFLPGTIADGASSGDGGHHVTLSGDGNYLAVVTTGMYPASPFATLYVLENGDWVSTGSFPTSATFEAAPVSIITKDGVGYVAIGNDAEVTYRTRGTVRVYRYIQAEVRWTQIGNTLEGTLEREGFGESLSLKENLHLAVGSPQYSRNGVAGSYEGAVKVFHYEEKLDTWTRVGQDLLGIWENERFGRALSLSADGQRFIAASAVWGSNSQGIEGISVVRAFQYNPFLKEWQQLGDDLEAEVGGEEFGFALSISSEGNRIAVSAPDQSNDSVGTGYVKVYELENIRKEARLLTETFPRALRRRLQN
jgi:hypothetical protein